ncbi:hypothetical protein GCK72_022225 [Caenorhabditis remanei]|uniref:Uncharacterized protein n=1 Tax=Caenorhabditis remanei TaxID=31234 RepID=A0A6A5FT62_CAERE|nr:hypothetical protein GCK72_022225 [Caenorhabditis remanei]KAF1745778.1 hypothetical protein GCK72_022225 [Caenorhabditis remanei]
MLPISNNRLGSTSKDQSDTVSHKSQHCLTLSTNSNYIQHVCNDASSPMYSGTRNSSVSINYPDSKEEANDLLLPNNLMPPRDPCASRLSTSSAWNSIRLSALSLSRVFFLKPCSKHKCCLGCISLRDAIPLICTVEMFSLVFTITIWKSKRRNWYIVHIIWQWTIIELFGFFIYMVVTWARNAEKQSILMPSAYVLIGATSFGALVEIWWLIIFVDAMLFEKSSDSYGSRRTSNENREDLEESESSNSPTSIRPNIKITENCEIVI